MAVFSSPNMIVMWVNIIFFMVVQTLFFQFIASKQFNSVVQDKVGIMSEYLNNDPHAKAFMAENLESDYWIKNQSTARQHEKQRNDENWALLLKWVGIPLLISTFFLIVFIIKMRFSKNGRNVDEIWKSCDTTFLCLVVLAYVTEILFFCGIVQKYEFYVDQKLIYNVLENIKSNLDN